MSEPLEERERQESAQRIYREHLSPCIYKEFVARALARRLSVGDALVRVLVALTVPGAVFGGWDWLKIVAVTSTSLALAVGLSVKVKRIEEARLRLSDWRSSADNLILRLEFDERMSRMDLAPSLTALQSRANEIDTFEDTAFLLLTARLAAESERLAAEELRRRGYS